MTAELALIRRGAGCPVARPVDRPVAGTSHPVLPRDPGAFGPSWERTTPPLAESLNAHQLAKPQGDGPHHGDVHRGHGDHADHDARSDHEGHQDRVGCEGGRS